MIGGELARVRDEPVGEDELRRAREHVKGRLALSMESTGARMNRLGRSVLMDTPLLSLDETIERLEAVDARGPRAARGRAVPAGRHVRRGDRPRRGPLPQCAGARERRALHGVT